MIKSIHDEGLRISKRLYQMDIGSLSMFSYLKININYYQFRNKQISLFSQLDTETIISSDKLHGISISCNRHESFNLFVTLKLETLNDLINFDMDLFLIVKVPRHSIFVKIGSEYDNPRLDHLLYLFNFDHFCCWHIHNENTFVLRQK